MSSHRIWEWEIPIPSGIQPISSVTISSVDEDEGAQENLTISRELRAGGINYPEQMTPYDRRRIREAAFKVVKMYPGPVGEILSRELFAWEEFGYRFGGVSLVRTLVDEIEKWRP
jgi:hypothetical protein